MEEEFDLNEIPTDFTSAWRKIYELTEVNKAVRPARRWVDRALHFSAMEWNLLNLRVQLKKFPETKSLKEYEQWFNTVRPNLNSEPEEEWEEVLDEIEEEDGISIRPAVLDDLPYGLIPFFKNGPPKKINTEEKKSIIEVMHYAHNMEWYLILCELFQEGDAIEGIEKNENAALQIFSKIEDFIYPVMYLSGYLLGIWFSRLQSMAKDLRRIQKSTTAKQKEKKRRKQAVLETYYRDNRITSEMRPYTTARLITERLTMKERMSIDSVMRYLKEEGII